MTLLGTPCAARCLAAKQLAKLAARKAAKKAAKPPAPAAVKPAPAPHLATRDAGAIAHPSEGRALTPERIAAFTVARDKPDYHVHIGPQTETARTGKMPMW
jgi:hypothetical protein